MNKNSYSPWEDEDIATVLEEDIEFTSNLVVLDDDFTSFDTVIDAFIDILKHDSQQAEQCAWIIHTKGKCAVKNGSHEELKPYKDALVERGLRAIIESI